PFSDISLLFFMDPPEDPPAPPKTLFSILHTRDGSALQGHLNALENGKLHFTTLHGNEIRIATSMMAALYFRNGKVIYLSDIPPTAVEENANYIRPIDGKPLASDLSYPWKKDQSAAGSPLVINGVEFQKGIGVRAYSSLRYDLENPFRRFQASIGIDDALPGGDVQFEVWIDDKVAFQTRAQAGEIAKVVDLDLSGAKQIRLVVDFGNNANVGDFADWGAARLIK
ncbi:MAG: NPCBM/NEW2 domain-containing protein, partial [Planctomycetota bacterium]|nr:NPCBM/NEW2 domain-containing protein [Planctomycetota bacterium]